MLYAAYFNQPEIIKYLHSLGCDVSQVSKNGEGALNRACYYKNYESAKVLTELGADINAKHSEYPIVSSIYRGNDKLVRFVLGIGADTSVLDKEEYKAVLGKAPKMVQEVIRCHKSNKARIPFLLMLKYSGSEICKMPTGILKEITMFIS